MSMAENELQKTEDLVKMLTDSKTVQFLLLPAHSLHNISCILVLCSKSQIIVTHCNYRGYQEAVMS